MLSPTKVTTGVPPQLSLAVTLAVSGAGTALAQATATAAGQPIVGGRLSLTVIVWVQVSFFEQASTALYALVLHNWLPILLALMLSPTKVTTGVPPQLSLAVTLAGSGSGTALAQATATAAGQPIVGGRVSLTVIVWVQVALLPQASLAREVRVRVNWLTQLLA